MDAAMQKKLMELKPLGERQPLTNNAFTNRNDVYGESSGKDLDDEKVKAALERAQQQSQ